jgi:peptidyl-prolyl cis-trans isomerase SurA
MRGHRTRRFVAATIALSCVVGLGVRAEVIEQVLVKVNGEIFTKTDLEARQVAALRQMGQQVDPKSDPSDAQLRKMLDEVTPQLLVSVVDEMLLVQRGKELGYTMGNEQFQSILESIKKDNKIESDEQLQAALKQENMTLSDLRKTLERQVIVSRVQQAEVLGKVTVSDEDARTYYEGHRAEFTSAQTISLREIAVNVPGDGKSINVGLDEEARAKAEKIRSRALAGESFEKLAADFSDAPSRANAGLVGPLNLSDLSPEVRALLEPMKVGDVTAVLRGPRGYQLLKLEARSAAELTPFDKAREEIGNRIYNDKRNQEFQKYLAKLRSQAIIEWKSQDLKKAYDQALAAPPKA